MADRDNTMTFVPQDRRLNGVYVPGATWAAPGFAALWLEDEIKGSLDAGDELQRWLAGRVTGELPAAQTDPAGSVPDSAVWLSETQFAAVVESLLASNSDSAAPFTGVAPDLALYARVLRLAASILDARDFVPFAAPEATSWPDIETACFALAETGDEGFGAWGSKGGQYAVAWAPVWRSARHRALRMAWVSAATELWDGSWSNRYPWPREAHGRCLAELWVWRSLQYLLQRFAHAAVKKDEDGSSYRVPYRGETELTEAWQAAYSTPSRTFAADGWLIWRALRQDFAQSGWRPEWLVSRTGEAYYHVELELVPPADVLMGDWQLVPYIAHNHWSERAPLREWWLQRDRQWRIGHELLVHPDEWLLPKLREAAAIAPPLERVLSQPAAAECVLTPDDVFAFLTEQVLKLEESGVTVRYPDVAASGLGDIRLRVHVRRAQTRSAAARGGTTAERHLSADQLVDFDWTLVIGEQALTQQEFEQMVQQRTPFVQVNGSWRLVPVKDILEQLDALRAGAGRGSVSTFQLLRVALMGQEADGDGIPVDVAFDDEAGNAEAVWAAFQEADKPAMRPVPSGFRGTLRDYQRLGYSWLCHLRSVGCGGVLADDMGLGKTIQVLAYLLHLKETGAVAGTHLLICPTSLLQNWRAEISRFAPELRAYLHHGAQRNSGGGEALAKAVGKYDVVLTTYATVVRDLDVLAAVPWDVIVADEAQNIKNQETKQAQAICALPARHRVALTGTPVENRLEELWSIFQFVNPGYLGGARWFRKTFVQPIAAGDHAASQRLQRLLQPVLLRRSKSNPQIQLELPDKWEHTQYAALTGEQAALYQSVLDQLFSRLPAAAGMSRRGQILAALVRLKQVCDHPCLVVGGAGGIERSGKMKLLLDLLDAVVDENESALVFTQFRDMGTLLCDAIANRFGWRPKFLHGGLSAGDRGTLVENFQSGADPAKVLVLSLKAGGIGLNLTRANHVFHFDRWWNPAVEDQATDRVFRIGQVKDVQVHKLVCPGTLEERIDELIQSKRKLSSIVIGSSESWITELDDDTLQSLFTLDTQMALEDDE